MSSGKHPGPRMAIWAAVAYLAKDIQGEKQGKHVKKSNYQQLNTNVEWLWNSHCQS